MAAVAVSHSYHDLRVVPHVHESSETLGDLLTGRAMALFRVSSSPRFETSTASGDIKSEQIAATPLAQFILGLPGSR
jgi:hypothetical protein